MHTDAPIPAENPPAYSTVGSTGIYPPQSNLTVISSQCSTATREGCESTEHAAQAASDDGRRQPPNRVRLNLIGTDGVSLSGPSHRATGRLVLAPGAPADGMLPGRRTRPRDAVRIPRCVALFLLSVDNILSDVCGWRVTRCARSNYMVPARNWLVSAGPPRPMRTLWRVD